MLIAQLLVTVFQAQRRGVGLGSCAESQGGNLGVDNKLQQEPGILLVEFAELCFEEGRSYVPFIFY